MFNSRFRGVFPKEKKRKIRKIRKLNIDRTKLTGNSTKPVSCQQIARLNKTTRIKYNSRKITIINLFDFVSVEPGKTDYLRGTDFFRILSHGLNEELSDEPRDLSSLIGSQNTAKVRQLTVLVVATGNFQAVVTQKKSET